MKSLLLHVPRNAFFETISGAFRVQNKRLATASLKHISVWATYPSHAPLCEVPRNESAPAAASIKSHTPSRAITPAIRLRHLSSTSISRQSATKEQDEATGSTIELPSHQEGRRSHISKRFSHVMDNVQANIFIAGQRLNDLTGYSGIEALKKEIDDLEELVRKTRAMLLQAKSDYTAAVAQRSASQREVNELLQRKNSWSAQDLERFTALYRSDHANEQAEANAQASVTAAEREAEEASSRLSATILARYHEEQIWSDKIRRMSTWGTWGLMGMNVLLFMIFQVAVEPWRRKRLVKGFEEKVMEALEREGAATNAATGAALAALQASHTATNSAVTNPTPTEAALISREDEIAAETFISAELSADLHGPFDAGDLADDVRAETSRWSVTRSIEKVRKKVADAFSERPVTVRRVDLTSAAIEGVFAGLAMASIVATLLVRLRSG